MAKSYYLRVDSVNVTQHLFSRMRKYLKCTLEQIIFRFLKQK